MYQLWAELVFVLYRCFEVPLAVSNLPYAKIKYQPSNLHKELERNETTKRLIEFLPPELIKRHVSMPCVTDETTFNESLGCAMPSWPSPSFILSLPQAAANLFLILNTMNAFQPFYPLSYFSDSSVWKEEKAESPYPLLSLSSRRTASWALSQCTAINPGFKYCLPPSGSHSQKSLSPFNGN